MRPEPKSHEQTIDVTNRPRTHCPRILTEAPIDCGFTLPECLAVLSIVAILSAICAGGLTSFIPAAKLGHATRAIVSLCRNARFAAIRNNRPVHLECSISANSCILTDSDGARELGKVDLAEAGPDIFLMRNFSTDFTSRGSSTRAGTMTVRNGAGKSLSITVRTSGGVVTK